MTMGNTWSRSLRQTANVTLNLLLGSDGDGNENGKKTMGLD